MTSDREWWLLWPGQGANGTALLEGPFKTHEIAAGHRSSALEIDPTAEVRIIDAVAPRGRSRGQCPTCGRPLL